MNTKTKRRLVVVSGIIIILLILALALIGGNTAAKTVSIAEASEGGYVNQKVQVTGNVVENSFETRDNTLIFDIYDPEGDDSVHLTVYFEGGVSATFGNDVTAICTGKIAEDGVLHASELVTKCPSKYESATDALSVSQLFGYGDSVYDKPVKISGVVKQGSLQAAGQGNRMMLVDKDGSNEIAIEFDGALSDDIQEGSSLIITGSLSTNGKFVATDVALEG